MSEIITPDTPDAPAPDLATKEGLTLALANAGDARVEDVDSFVSALDAFRSALTSAAREAKRALNARRSAAQGNAGLRRFILTPSGPDWGAKTQAYRDVVNAIMEDAFPVTTDFTKEDRNRELTAIRQHVNRTYLELEIRQYVRDSNEGMPTVDESDTDSFRHKVKSEYKRCELTVPDAYLSPEEKAAKKEGRGGPGAGPSNPTEAATALVNGLDSFAPKYAALTLLAGMSKLVAGIDAGNSTGGIEDRQATKEVVLRIQTLAQYARKAIDGKASPDDRESIAEALFGEADAKA